MAVSVFLQEVKLRPEDFQQVSLILLHWILLVFNDYPCFQLGSL
jgi:hypothetical protein